MTGISPPAGSRRRAAQADPHDWMTSVAASAAAACGVPVELLGEYLQMLADAAIHGRRPAAADLAAVRELGRLAAEQGVGAGQAVQLYLSAAWRLWRELPLAVRSRDREKVRAAAEAVLRVLDDAIGILVDGHQSARRDMIRHEEALRREFIDDLLRGDADVSRTVERAEPFGLDLSKPHQVALAAPKVANGDIGRAAIMLERAIVDRFGDRDVLVATKDDRVVVLIPGALSRRPAPDRTVEVSGVIEAELGRLNIGEQWRVASGRPFSGAYGIARSYEEAREALTLAERLDFDGNVDPQNLLMYRVLGRDQAAIIDLVADVLGPLNEVRGGADLLIDTLHAYFNAGDVATEAARRLHVSIRTVTYRLAKVKDLTGYSTADPQQRFMLHAAVLGARLLEWPRRSLPPS
jgi:sugar diacid utilization regulator